MVLAVKPSHPRRVYADRLARGVSPLTLSLGAAHATLTGKKRAKETEAQKRARLMQLTRCLLHVSENVPVGAFTIIDPSTMDPTDRATCPFTSKTLVVNPDDIERAIGHFETGQEAPQKVHG